MGYRSPEPALVEHSRGPPHPRIATPKEDPAQVDVRNASPDTVRATTRTTAVARRTARHRQQRAVGCYHVKQLSTSVKRGW